MFCEESNLDCKNKNCNEKVYGSYDYCILHVKLPEDEDSTDFQKINELKEKKVKEKIRNNDYDFTGVQLAKVDCHEENIDGNLIFVNAKINGNVNFNEAKINGNVNFNGAEIKGNVIFSGSEINGNVTFDGKLEPFKKTIIKGDVYFRGATINQGVFFRKSKVNGDFKIDWAKIGFVTRFQDAQIGGEAWFMKSTFGNYVEFISATIGKWICFTGSEINGFANFYDAKFNGNAYFSHVIFNMEAYFERTTFYQDVKFKGTLFKENAFFQNSTFIGNKGLFEDITYFKAGFESARLQNVAFRHCNLTKVRFREVIFENCELSTSILPNKVMEHDEYDYKKSLKIKNLNLTSKMTPLDKITILAPINLVGDANVVADVYRRIKQCLNNQGAYAEASDFYIKEMDVRRKEIYKKKDKKNYIFYTFLNFTSTYGEDPKNLAMLIIYYYVILIFIVYYWDINPKNPYFIYFNIAIIPLGSFLMALFVYIFAKKMSK